MLGGTDDTCVNKVGRNGVLADALPDVFDATNRLFVFPIGRIATAFDVSDQ